MNLSVLILASLLGVATSFAQTTPSIPFGRGTGTQADPYQISSLEHLNSIRDNESSGGVNYLAAGLYFILMNDLDFSGHTYDSDPVENDKGWLPIGSEHYSSTGLSGSFDGKGHVIRNLFINRPGYSGLFEKIVAPGSIKNLGLESLIIIGTSTGGGLVGVVDIGGIVTSCYSSGQVTGSSVGGLIGSNQGIVTSCYSSADVTGTSFFVGGFAGSSAGQIISCHSTGAVTGSTWAGGFVGFVNGEITSSYSTGDVIANGPNLSSVGGFAGGVQGQGEITSSYSTGDIIASASHVGGFAGSVIGEITSCYSIGTVTGSNLHVGGFAGSVIYGSLAYCYSRGNAGGKRIVGGFVGSIELGSITSCYSTGMASASTDIFVGGFIGGIDSVELTNSYWENPDAISGDDDPTDRTPVQIKALTLTDLGDARGLFWDVGDNSQYPALRMMVVDNDRTSGGPADLTFGALTIGNQAYTVNTAIANLQLPVAIGGTGSLLYTLMPALPGGLSFDADTRILMGTPDTEKEVTEYTYTVNDGASPAPLTANLMFTITVNPEGAPTFRGSISNQTYTVGTAIEAVTLPEATGGIGALTYAFEPALPGGLSFDADNRISGTPWAVGSVVYTYTVTDSGNPVRTATLTFTIRVSAVSAETFAARGREFVVGVYPNPTGGILHLELPVGAFYEVSVLTLTGQAALGERQVGGGSRTMDLSSLKGGVYFLKVEDDEGISQTFRIIR